MDIDLNRCLQTFQSARTLQPDAIKGLSQKDRKILSVLMNTILKSKEGCRMENVGEEDLATLDKDIKAGPPEDHKESGINDKIGNFFKNIFSKRISSKSLFDKIEKTNKKVALLIDSENQIKKDKTKIETTITEKTKKLQEQQKTLVGIQNSKDLVEFLKRFAARVDGLDYGDREQAIKLMEPIYNEQLKSVDAESPQGKSFQESLQTLNNLSQTLAQSGTKGAKKFIQDYFDNNKNTPSEKELKRQIEKSQKEIDDLKQQAGKLANQEAIISKLKTS